MYDGPTVIVFTRGGRVSAPLANAVPSLPEWVDALRDIATDNYVAAVVVDTRRLPFRPGWSWPPHAPDLDADALT